MDLELYRFEVVIPTLKMQLCPSFLGIELVSCAVLENYGIGR